MVAVDLPATGIPNSRSEIAGYQQSRSKLRGIRPKKIKKADGKKGEGRKRPASFPLPLPDGPVGGDTLFLRPEEWRGDVGPDSW